MKTYKKTINIPMYKGKLGLLITDSPKMVRSVTNYQDFNDTHVVANTIFGHTVENKEKLWCVWVCLNPNNNTLKAGYVAHEAVHVANMVFEKLDINYDKQNDEHHAYFVEWIVGKLWKEVKKYKRSRTSKKK